MFRFLIALFLLPAPHLAASGSLESPAGSGSLAPGLAALDDGQAVLTWLEPVEGGHALKFARFDGHGFGEPGEIARGAGWFANWADTPALYVTPDGDWIAHWLEKSGPATYAYDIRMVRSSDRGRTWSQPISPHRDGTPTEHGFVSYFPWPDGATGVVWLDGRLTAPAHPGGSGDGHEHGHGGAGPMTLRTAALGRDGGIDREVLLDERVCDCCITAAGVTDSGPVVVYRDRSPDEIRDISIVRWTGEGWSEPATVHPDGWEIGGCPVNGPDLLARGEEVVVAWFTMPEGVPQVRLARSTDSGRSFSETARFSVGQALGRVQLAPWKDGYLMLWMTEEQGRGVLRLAGFGAGVEPRMTRTLGDVEAGRASGVPRMVAVAGERLLLAWTESEDGQRRVAVGLIEPQSPRS